jgi:hypothetical protein
MSAMKYLNSIDLNKNELQNARLQNLGSDPTPAAGDKGYAWFNTATNLAKVWDGATVHTLTNLLESVAGTGAISVSAVAGKSQTISVAAASGSVPGTMSSADFTKLAAATATNTVSTLVLRDASGNFAAGTITAALTGTASNATNLNNQAATYYLSRANHTGTQLAATISDLASTVQAYRLDQFAAPTTALAFNGQRLTGVADPTGSQDAATKNYVDSMAAGLDVKASVRVASVANVTATYTSTGGPGGRGQLTAAPTAVDGITLAVGNRILLKNQTTAAQNGIYVVTTLGTGANGVWDRASDFDTDPEVTSGSFTFIEEGTQSGTGWVLTTPNPITIGGAAGTALAFAQFSSSASYTAGSGLQLVGSQFSAVGTTNRISVSGAGIDIAATYVGQASITTVGTIGTGTWQGTAVGLAYGGTGATTVAAAKTNLGFMGRYAADIGDGSTTTITVTHSLNTLDCQVALFQKSDGAEVMANVVHATVNTVTIAFSVAPASASLRVVVIG